MMSLTFGLFNQVSGLGPLGPLVLKRGNFCDFLFIYLDGNPSKKGIEAVHVRLDFTKLCSFFVVTLVSRVHLRIRCLAMSLSGSHCGWVDERLAI